MSRHLQALRIVGLALLGAVVFSLLLQVLPWRAELAETNFQANLIRLQAFLFDPPPRTVLVGSSISGRLLPNYFESTQLQPVANLGLDGSSPVFGLELALQRPPALVVVEENTLLKPWDANDESLAAATRSPSFRLARYLPVLRARYRPSSILYTWAKLRRNPGTSARSEPVPPAPAVETSPAPTASSTVETPEFRELKARLARQIQALKERGTRVVLLRLPAGDLASVNQLASLSLSAALASELQVPRVDLTAECARRGELLTYTDGLHLTPASANSVSRLLATLLAELPRSPSPSGG